MNHVFNALRLLFFIGHVKDI